MASADRIESLVYTIHGPPGFGAAALLREHAITLLPDDVLLIAEHDEATRVWLECEPSRPRKH